ncbi:FkbM family methyltransferase [Sulfolobus sp. E5-1-F]|uniref:FkbM family methyltransferase n=1 Tax=Saccharolobus sp. E5-1-F TaxID=2663019 RepID=UPI001294E464|nr:FkbM family methyltransferase [Sulfolobus sp. E5-1-F]QGA54105.1 FkbM family methyltransferase [Sulfolobus sp. E5-1-F]
MRIEELKPKPPSLRDYLSVKPSNFSSGLFLYYTYLKTYINLRYFNKFPKISEEYTKLLKVKFDDMYWYVRKENLIHDIWMILLHNEPEVRNWISFEKGMVFVDVGAYIGSYTIRAGKRGANVIAFEPNPISFKILELNVKENKLMNNVKLFNMAVWSTICKIELFANNDMTSAYEISGNKISADAITLDSLSLKKVNLLKIDVEGAEVEVLKGATNTLDVTDKILIEVRKEFEKEVNELLRNKGFRLAKVDMTYDNIGNFLYERAS